MSRGMTVLLSAAMIAGAAPVPAYAATVESVESSVEAENELTDEKTVTASAESDIADENLVLLYDFTKVDSTIINDSTSHGKAGVIRNYDAGGFKIMDANIYGRAVKAMSLPGGSDGGYLELPVGTLDGLTETTISMWVRLKTNTGYQRIWDFGTGTDKYIYLLSNGGNEGFQGYAAAATTDGWTKEEGVSTGTDKDIEKNKWVLTTVTIKDKTMKLYADGKLIGTKELSKSLEEMGSFDKCYIGYGQFGDAPTNGDFADVTIYDHALSESQVADLFDIDDDARVKGDKENLVLDVDTDCVTEDFKLPVKGSNGSKITWTSDNEDVIKVEDGEAHVTQPKVGKEKAEVTLTAKLTLNGAEEEKTFKITVVPELSDEERAKEDLDAIELENLDALTENLELPGTGAKNKSEITWKSNDEEHLTSDGKITRPEVGEQDAEVTLTATAKLGDAEVTREFVIKVLSKKDAKSIVSVDPISVTTKAGVAPVLPNQARVHFSDGSIRKIKLSWPSSIDKEKYAEIGEFDVTGSLVGVQYDSIKVHVTVEADDAEAELKADGFDLSEVRLDSAQDSILTQNMSRDVKYLKKLDNDRMLYNFRKTFGTDTKGAKPLGGWDEPTGLLRGHSTGHYISALAIAYASTGDKEIKEKLDYMIHELRTLQLMTDGNAADFKTKGTDQKVWNTDPKEWGKGFISAYSPDQFALLEQYVPYATIWAPYYTLHKLEAGFIDAYTYTGNKEALDIAKDLGSWVHDRLAATTPEQRTKMWDMYIAGELGGMNESMAKLYELTGDDEYFETAQFFDNTKFFNNLSQNIDDIHERHANQHIPQIVGALEEYEATVKKGEPDKDYYRIAKNFWNRVTRDYIYSIGGVGTGEKFKEAGKQAQYIATDTNCETCAAYNMLKLTKKLYSYDPDDASYMDYYERTLYNQIIASQDPSPEDSNNVTYMLPIGNGVHKSYSDDYQSFTCCHGTGMENHVKYQEAAYYHEGDELYVNLYMPAELNWKEKGLKISQKTAFPSEDSEIEVSASDEGKTKPFNMKLRVPYWAENGYTVTLNGKEVISEAEPSTYVELKNVKAGDKINVHAEFGYHLDATPDKLNGSEVASVMYGPLVLVGKTSTTAWKTLRFAEDMDASIKQDKDDPLKMTTNGLSFEPMYRAHHYAYSAYFKILQSNDDAVYYSIALTNESSDKGTIEVNSELIKENGTLEITAVPKSGFKVKTMLVDGKEIKPYAENKYKVENVTKDLSVVVRFGKVLPTTADPAHLEYAAEPASDYTASWENLDGVNNPDNNPTKSNCGTRKGWGNWSQPQGSSHWIAYNWDIPVKLNTNEIFWYDDGGGTRVPASISFEYKDENGEWHEAVMTGENEDIFKLDEYNTIKLETVTATALRMNVIISSEDGAAGTGVVRWKVSYVEENTPDDPNPTPDDPTPDDPNPTPDNPIPDDPNPTPDNPAPTPAPEQEKTPTEPANGAVTGGNVLLVNGGKYVFKTDFKVKKFTVSDKKVLKVSKSGKATVKKSGLVTVTATGKKGETKTFENIYVEKPVMNSKTVTSKASFNVSEMLSGVTHAKITSYSSSKTKVAAIDDKGQITILSKGTTKITVIINGKKYKKSLKVKI